MSGTWTYQKEERGILSLPVVGWNRKKVHRDTLVAMQTRVEPTCM